MGLLNNLGVSGSSGAMNPLMNMLMGNMNPQMKQMMGMARQMCGGSDTKAKQLVLEKIQKEGITKEQFEIVKAVNPNIAKEVEKYVR